MVRPSWWQLVDQWRPCVAGQYPGNPGKGGADDVVFDPTVMGGGRGPATLDVGISPLQSIDFRQWGNTLTLNRPLVVTGNNGYFLLNDASTISLAAGTSLMLLDLGPAAPNGKVVNSWQAGNITGAANTTFGVVGSQLSIQAAFGAGSLGVNMMVGQSPWTGSQGIVQLERMAQNLMLSGANNYIDIQAGGTLFLLQQIAVAGAQNTEGGIELDPAHTGSLSVQIKGGGTLTRAAPQPREPSIKCPLAGLSTTRAGR